tara:strand:- start:64 stop:1059 length:996 start_codon:yes stop_codon:yes gene_type:complete
MSKIRNKLTDNIGTANAFFHKLMKDEKYESYDGGSDIQEPLMYALSDAEPYSGYDELASDPIDGITNAVYLARQLAVPISYSMEEALKNKHRIYDLIRAKVEQARMGIEESFATHFMQGAGAGALATAKTNSSTGAKSIDPVSLLIHQSPTDSVDIGNIDQSAESWWRNVSKDMDTTTYDGLMLQLNNLSNTCALGTGGAPDMYLMDQTTYELFVHAHYQKYGPTTGDATFPFENTRFKGSLVVMDEKVPDFETGTITYTVGSVLAFNSKFFKIRYIPERNFEMLEDENGKSFAKPLKGDSRLGHIAWMGQATCNNRRKQGMGYGIARTLS